MLQHIMEGILFGIISIENCIESNSFKRHINPIPIFHIYGLNSGLFATMLLSTSIVFPFYFPETLSTMKAIQHFKAETMRGTPTQFIGSKMA
jgi:acyl-CoA synthetase (AMP-forming)/AMP-acid ligase II